MNRRHTYIILLILLFLPSLLLANAGFTALGAASFIHLVFGCLIISFIEIGLIHLIYRLKTKWLMILVGNYLSGLIGIFLGWILIRFDPKAFSLGYEMSLYINMFFKLLVSYVITIFVEYPFFKWAIIKNISNRKLIKLTVFVTAISYVFLAVWYLFAIHEEVKQFNYIKPNFTIKSFKTGILIKGNDSLFDSKYLKRISKIQQPGKYFLFYGFELEYYRKEGDYNTYPERGIEGPLDSIQHFKVLIDNQIEIDSVCKIELNSKKYALNKDEVGDLKSFGSSLGHSILSSDFKKFVTTYNDKIYNRPSVRLLNDGLLVPFYVDSLKNLERNKFIVTEISFSEKKILRDTLYINK